MQTKYAYDFTLIFAVRSDSEDPDTITEDQMWEALRERLSDLRSGSIKSECWPPSRFDYETEPPAYYVLVIAPMDQCFVGPFLAKMDADALAERHRGRFENHDCSVMTADEKQSNEDQFGALPVLEPAEYQRRNPDNG